jgi:hypothetical protein
MAFAVTKSHVEPLGQKVVKGADDVITRTVRTGLTRDEGIS